MDKNIEFTIKEILDAHISYVWRGHGSAIFIELGNLSIQENRNHPVGEYSIMLDCDWRIESSAEILCGSYCDEDEIEQYIDMLVGDTLSEIQFNGVLPEINLILASGKRVLSFTSSAGQPEWGIFLSDKSWLESKAGMVVRSHS